MEEIRINRLPLLTYRYLHTNDTPLSFEEPKAGKQPVFSDMTYVEEGGRLPEAFRGCSEETVRAAEKGAVYTVVIPAGVKARLSVTAETDADNPDFRGAFLFRLEEGASLSLVWRIRGGAEKGTAVLAVYYELAKDAALSSSLLSSGLSGTAVYDQRHVECGENAKAEFYAAELGGETAAVHSYGHLAGNRSSMEENIVYAAGGSQHLDLFCHIDQEGRKTAANINVNGALDGKAKKIFRGTLNFLRGCGGSVGDEGDYAIQLSPQTKNVSLPLLLCTEDDVQGNHASSSGQLDANTLYFLMSRGFSLEEARRIMIESMIRPVVDRMDASIREEVLAEIGRKLDAKENQ